MTNKPTHDVLLVEDYKTQSGEDRSFFTNIGRAWPTEDGNGMSVKLREGLSVSGRFVILPKRDDAAAAQ